MKLESGKFVIAFSGKVGSGKTTLSTQLSRILECEWISFSMYIRKIAAENNLGEDRKTLQDLGALLLEQDLESFCINVLNQIQWKNSSFIIDGIRHIEVLEFLRKSVNPIPLLHIHITIDRIHQIERLQKRASEKNTLDYIEEHATESQIQHILPGSADLILNSKDPVDQLIKDIIDFLSLKKH